MTHDIKTTVGLDTLRNLCDTGPGFSYQSHNKWVADMQRGLREALDLIEEQAQTIGTMTAESAHLVSVVADQQQENELLRKRGVRISELKAALVDRERQMDIHEDELHQVLVTVKTKHEAEMHKLTQLYHQARRERR